MMTFFVNEFQEARKANKGVRYCSLYRYHIIYMGAMHIRSNHTYRHFEAFFICSQVSKQTLPAAEQPAVSLHFFTASLF